MITIIIRNMTKSWLTANKTFQCFLHPHLQMGKVPRMLLQEYDSSCRHLQPHPYMKSLHSQRKALHSQHHVQRNSLSDNFQETGILMKKHIPFRDLNTEPSANCGIWPAAKSCSPPSPPIICGGGTPTTGSAEDAGARPAATGRNGRWNAAAAAM